MNPFRDVNWRPDLVERRKFARSLVVGFPCVALVLLLAQRWHVGAWHFQGPMTLGGIGAIVGVVLWFLPQIARPFYVVWYGIACCIGIVVGNAVIAAVYLVMFAPLGLVMRAARRKAFSRSLDRSAATYWRDAESTDDAARYYRQY